MTRRKSETVGEKTSAVEGRPERLARALRENLRRRKIQARARQGPGDDESRREGKGAGPQGG